MSPKKGITFSSDSNVGARKVAPPNDPHHTSSRVAHHPPPIVGYSGRKQTSSMPLPIGAPGNRERERGARERRERWWPSLVGREASSLRKERLMQLLPTGSPNGKKV